MEQFQNKLPSILTLEGEISYKDLLQIVYDYFKETEGIELGSISIDYLPSILNGTFNDRDKFFFVKGEFGASSFNLSKEEFQAIFQRHLASKNYELEGGLNFGNKNITFKYKKIKQQEQAQSANKNTKTIVFDYIVGSDGIPRKNVNNEKAEIPVTGPEMER